MDLFGFQYVCCGATQPRASFGDKDPHINFCCMPLEETIIGLLKKVDEKLTPTGKCLFCDQPQDSTDGAFAVYCCRQSCTALYAHFEGITLFLETPCAWSWHDVSPSDQEWNAKAVAEAQRGPQHLSVRARNTLESLVYDTDPLQMFLRHEAAKSGA